MHFYTCLYCISQIWFLTQYPSLSYMWEINRAKNSINWGLVTLWLNGRARINKFLLRICVWALELYRQFFNLQSRALALQDIGEGFGRFNPWQFNFVCLGRWQFLSFSVITVISVNIQFHINTLFFTTFEGKYPWDVDVISGLLSQKQSN